MVNKRIPTDLMLNCLNWQPLSSRREEHPIIATYKCHAGLAPSYLSNIFEKLADVSPGMFLYGLHEAALMIM